MTPVEVGATIVTILMFLSNVPVVSEFWRRGSTGPASIVPFVSTFINCMLWAKYGVLLQQNTILLVNGIGAIISVICIYSFWRFTDKRSLAEKWILYCVGFVFAVYLYVTLVESSSTPFQLGILCACFSILMFGSPLVSLSQVIRLGSVTGLISLPLAALSFLCSLLWTLIGFSISDNFVIIPNFLGCTLCVIQLGVYFWYSTSKRPDPISVESTVKLMPGSSLD